jgi:phosphoglycolate phosphatase-like HAD superfamily hydrolase
MIARVMLFDIDGTLVLTVGAGLRAMSRAFKDVFAADDDAFAGIPIAGRTDQIILADALARLERTADAAAHAKFRGTYYAYLREEVGRPGPRKGVLPGVRELLAALSVRDDVLVGLLTGNFAEGARIKLEHFDLWRHFRCGAFGDDAADRNALVAFALDRAAAFGFGGVPSDRVFVIGDTPLDVACAAAAGARAVAVATGHHAADELRAAGAHVVFDDLSETDRVLSALEIGRAAL